MNERIRELNLQAMSIVMNGSDPDGDVEQMYIPSEFTKKFAELIVAECLSKVNASHPLEERSEWVQNSFAEETIKRKIKEHFGVEE
jgi:hypothetical protein